MSAFLTAFQAMQTSRKKSVHLRDLPTFGEQPHESAEEFILRYGRCAIVHNWNDSDKLKYMNLSCEDTALRWHEANRAHFATFSNLEKEFLKAFGKNLFDLELQNFTRRFSAADNPLTYVFETLDCILLPNPAATETEKVERLFDGLPANLKSAFVRDSPATVQAFIEWLKKVSREQQYNEKALGHQGLLAAVAALGTTDPTGVQSRELKPTIKTQTTTEQVKSVYFAREQEWDDKLRSIDRRLSDITEMLENNKPKTPPPMPSASNLNRTAGRAAAQIQRDTCNFCGREGHLARNCRSKFDQTGRLNPNWQPSSATTGFRFQGPRFDRYFYQPERSFYSARSQSLEMRPSFNASSSYGQFPPTTFVPAPAVTAENYAPPIEIVPTQRSQFFPAWNNNIYSNQPPLTKDCALKFGPSKCSIHKTLI